MKRILKLSLLSFVAIFALFTLVGCAGINEDFAAEIKEKAKVDEHYTYADLVDKLGDPTIDVSSNLGGLIGVSGVVQWSKGCADKAALDEKLEAGKTVPTLYVTFLNGKATSAEYKELAK